MGALTSWLAPVAKSTAPAYRTSPKQTPPGGVSLIYRDQGRVGKAHAALFRNWAEHSDLPRSATNYIVNQVSQSEWDIVPYDTTARYDTGLQKAIHSLFEQPNDAIESFHSFVMPVIEDMVVLDAGTIEKERTYGGELYALHGADGGRVKVNSLWDGDPNEPRYYWVVMPGQELSFKNADLVYMMSNPRTYSAVGLSPYETLKLTIDWELNGSAFNARQVQNAAPDGVLDLGEGARPEQVEAFRSMWAAEIAGRGAMAIMGGTKAAKWMPFRTSNRDMQFLEWQQYLGTRITMVFGLSPQDLGWSFNINRSEGEVQLQISESKGLRPYMTTTQDYFTQEIVWDKSFGGRDNNLCFRWTRLNRRESLGLAQINKIAGAGIPWKSINAMRADDGLLPIGDAKDEANVYNQLLANTPLGIVNLSEVSSAKEVSSPEPPPSTTSTPPSDAAKEMGLLMERSLTAQRETHLEELHAFVEAAQAQPEHHTTVEAPTTISEGAVQVHVSTPPAPNVEVHPPHIEMHASPIEVHPADVHIHEGAVQVTIQMPETRKTVKTVNRDKNGRIIEVIED